MPLAAFEKTVFSRISCSAFAKALHRPIVAPPRRKQHVLLSPSIARTLASRSLAKKGSLCVNRRTTRLSQHRLGFDVLWKWKDLRPNANPGMII